MLGGRRTWIGALLGVVVAAGVFAVVLVFSGDGGESRTEEADRAYLEAAHRIRQLTVAIDRASEDTSARPAAMAVKFSGFREVVSFTAERLLTLEGIGPVADRGFVLHHSLGIYEYVLGVVARRAREGDHRLQRLLGEVRKVGVEVRAANAAWERALEAALAD
ncbi:MAG TPA: hypothetical protein VGI73_09035 [Solirubrobacterales bacterium]|jgi:hypothetical protein